MSQARCVLKVKELDCPVEAEALRGALEGYPGVTRLGFDLIRGTLTVEHQAGAITPGALIARVSSRTGMHATLLERAEPEPPGWWARHGRRAPTVGSGLALAAGVSISRLGGPGSGPGDGDVAMSWARAAFALSVVLGGIDLFPRAWGGLRRGRLDIHVLMGLAVAGAVLLGQWDEAATVAFLFGLAEGMEALSLERARRAVRALLEIAPETAEVRGADGVIRTVPADEVRPGDRVQVRAGGRIPVDGAVASGRSSVDQKAITGESLPVPRSTGDPVYAGTVNGEGALEVEASGTAGDALIARIAATVRAAQSSRAPVERRIARFAAWYTPAVVAVAVLVMLVPVLAPLLTGQELGTGTGAGTGTITGPIAGGWRVGFTRGLVVLVIACPCALVIATPVAVVSALAAAARRGVLVKGGEFLEEFGRLRALAFDKTGTLTRGEPDVVEVIAADGHRGDDVLRIAAALGDRGGHLLGRAIARHARRLRLDVPVADAYTAVPGLGARGHVEAVEYHIGSHRYLDEAGLCPRDFHLLLSDAESADVGTAVALSSRSGPLGWIRLADRARPEAARVLAELAELGVRPALLTGDDPRTAAAIARELGIAEHRGALLPEDKVAALADLDARHGPAGMVGDGVNDAPALASARVSVALGGISSAVALETADVVLMADDLGGLPWLVRHSRRTHTRIRQNIFLALATKAVVLALALFGLAGLWLAIAADVGTSLLVTANALRLLAGPPLPSRDAAPRSPLPPGEG